MSIFKRGNVYWYHFLFNGEHVQKSTKQGNPRTARQMEAAYKTALAKGEVGITERKPIPTLADSIENRFTPWARATFEQASPKTWTGWYRTQLTNISGYGPLVSRKLDSITSEHAADYAAYLQTKEWQPSSVNSSLRVLRRALRLAVEWGHQPDRAEDQTAQGRASPGACRRTSGGSAVSRSGGRPHGRYCDCADRHWNATGRELAPSLGVYWLVEWAIRNATGDARQDCGGAADASLESACAGAARATLGSGKDALRGLGVGDSDSKRSRRAFYSEEAAPAGAKAQWSAPLRSLRSPSYLPHAAWGSGLRCLDSGADRGPLFDCHVRAVRSPQPGCRDEHFFPPPDAERASCFDAIGIGWKTNLPKTPFCRKFDDGFGYWAKDYFRMADNPDTIASSGRASDCELGHFHRM